MAIGTITASQERNPASAPLYVDVISFTGDTSYPDGGTADFEDSFQAITEDRREILGVIAGDCGGYIPVYDKGNDKLKVYEAGADGGPLDQVTATTPLNGTTFNLIVLSK